MKKIENIALLNDYVSSYREKGKLVALVPTMGALHAGHVKLVEEAKNYADIVITYIFVNPTQFAEGEDLDTYPRTLEADIEKLEAVDCDALWLPSVQDIYPNGVEANIQAGEIAKPLEGANRPHFFNGVVSVLARMFVLSAPDVVMMGEKDFQQLQVVRKMVADKKFPLEIIGVETARDENGLALSSRNAYLSEAEYKIAIQLNKILKQLADNELSEVEATQALIEAGFDKVDYCTHREAENLCPNPKNPDRVLAAAWLGQTRLIDNMAMKRKT